MCRWYLILKITQQKWIILPATVDHKQYLLVHVSSYGLVWSELDFELVDIHSVNKRQCLVLSEQSFLGSFSAPYSTVIDFTKLFEEINLDSSCGCQKLLVPLVPCSQWNFSLPTLVLQLISPPLLVLFHLPFGLAKAAAGQHSPKTQLWVLFQATDEQNCCSPLLKGNGEPSPHLLVRSGQAPMSTSSDSVVIPTKSLSVCASLHWHLLPCNFSQPMPLKAPLLLDLLSLLVAVVL